MASSDPHGLCGPHGPKGPQMPPHGPHGPKSPPWSPLSPRPQGSLSVPPGPHGPTCPQGSPGVSHGPKCPSWPPWPQVSPFTQAPPRPQVSPHPPEPPAVPRRPRAPPPRPLLSPPSRWSCVRCPGMALMGNICPWRATAAPPPCRDCRPTTRWAPGCHPALSPGCFGGGRGGTWRWGRLQHGCSEGLGGVGWGGVGTAVPA